MKTFKIATALQLVYCMGCLISIFCLLLYDAFYPAAFTEICWQIGLPLTLISILNPMGTIGSVISCVQYCSSVMKKSKRSLALVIAMPILIVLLWVLTFSFLCYYTSGV